MAYSMDIRKRVAAMHAQTGSSEKTAAHYGVSESWVRRLAQRQRETNSLEPRSSARKDDQRVYNDEDEAVIRQFIKGKSDATLMEVAEHLKKPAGLSTVSRTLGRLNLVRKKSPSTPARKNVPT